MRTTHLVAVACAATVLVACQDGTTASPIPRAGKAALAAISNHHVVGSGHIAVGLTDDLREFTFHAVEAPDGSVSGTYKVERTDTGIFFTVDVTCMTVVGDTGWVAGIISETNAPNVRVGTVSYFWAVDNGEGNNAPADIVSTARINDPLAAANEFCTQRPLRLPPNTVQFGNVQVR